MQLHIKVKPNARQSSLSFRDGVLEVRIKAPPTDGKANIELVRYLSEFLEIPKSKIEIVSGAGSRHKRIQVPDEYEQKIQQIIAGVRNG